ncbi:MAG: hypothetical protein U0Z53_11135 [Blastocatellia bacterium]
MTKQQITGVALSLLWLCLMVTGSVAQTSPDALPAVQAINWKDVGTYSSGVLAFFDTGKSLLMSAGGKIHRSTDGGNTWVESNTGNTITAPTGFAVLGTKVFVAGSNAVAVSTSDGQSWTKVSDLIGANSPGVYNNVLYATTTAAAPNGGRVYRSTDEGATWTQLFQLSTLNGITSFAAVDGALVVASDLAGLYRSTDNGVTWASVKAGTCSGVTASGNTFYASFTDGLYRSRDKGANWIRTNLYPLSAASKPAVSGSRIFVRDTSGTEDIKYSPNEGYYWTSATTPTSFISTIFARPGLVLVGTLTGKVYLGTQLDTLPPAPTGGYWENLTSLAGITATLQLYAFGNTLFVNSNNKLLRSVNFGLSWEDKTPAGARLNIAVQNGTQLAAGSKYIFMASDGAVWRSDDQGSTWQTANNGIAPASGCVWVFAKGETVFTYASSRFYRSLDSGSNWTEIPGGVLRNPDGMIAVGANLLRFDRDGAVNKSTDNGTTWTKITTTGLPAPVVSSNTSSFSSIAASGGAIFVILRNSTQGGVYKSTDEGQTWTKVTATVAGITNPPLAGNLLYDGKNLLIITEGGKNGLGNSTFDVCLSTDGGQSYTKLNANTINFTNYDVIAIAAIGSKIFSVNGSRDVWTGTGFIITPQTTVSAATYVADSATPEGIASAFGSGMTIFTESAATIPLPTTLGDIQVKVKDSAGVERSAGLFYVSPTQVNYQIPPGTAPGTAMVTVTSVGGATVASGNVTVSSVAPGLFTLNQDGAGVPAALVLRISAGGATAYEPVGQKDGTGKYVPTPIDVGPTTDRVYIALFGTGVRGRTDLGKVSVSIGGQAATVDYAGAQGQYVGLDQINVLIPRALAGRGETDLVLTVDGKIANTVRVSIR